MSPAWWPALTRYVADSNAAWHAFAAAGRRAHPRLRIVFAMLAGGAPFHAERLAARGGPMAALADPDVFYDSSSYGPRAVEAVAGWVGSGQVVYGSDRPVVDPGRWSAGPLDPRREALLVRNPARLLGAAGVLA